MAERPNARLLNSLGRESRGFKSHSLRHHSLRQTASQATNP